MHQNGIVVPEAPAKRKQNVIQNNEMPSYSDDPGYLDGLDDGFGPADPIPAVAIIQPEQPEQQAVWAIDQSWDEALIPKRPWIVPGFLMRGTVNVTSGPGAAGKSSLMCGWACSGALGMEYGQFIPPAPLRVAFYNVEDDQTEQRLRFSATCRQFGRTTADLFPNLKLLGPEGTGLLFSDSRDGELLVNTAAMDALHAHMVTFKPDVLILDPFVELHASEENDNTAIRQVMARFRSLARELNCAIVLLHHTRKGAQSPGDPDSLRGASLRTASKPANDSGARQFSTGSFSLGQNNTCTHLRGGL